MVYKERVRRESSVGARLLTTAHVYSTRYIVDVIYVIVKERHVTIMGYKPRERVALEWFIPIIVELLVL